MTIFLYIDIISAIFIESQLQVFIIMENLLEGAEKWLNF